MNATWPRGYRPAPTFTVILHHLDSQPTPILPGRAYPDISAQATGFTVVANGFNNPGVAGTSCATPTASGVIALVCAHLVAVRTLVLGGEE